MKFHSGRSPLSVIHHGMILVLLALLTVQCNSEAESSAAPIPNILTDPPLGSSEAFFPEELSTMYRPHGALAFKQDLTRVWWSIYTPDASQFHQSIAEAVIDSLRFDQITLLDLASGYSAGGVVVRDNGNQLYFNLNAPVEQGGDAVMNLWYVDKVDSGWSNPEHLDIPLIGSYIGSQFCFGPEEGSLIVTMREDGGSNNLYMTRAVEGNTYSTPEKLSSAINSDGLEADSWYDPVSGLLLFMSHGRADSYGDADLYASRYLGDGEWSQAINLGESVNTEGFERFPSVSPDGSCLFFVRDYAEQGVEKTGFFWISMETIRAFVE